MKQNYAGFWKRFWAFIIDNIIVFIAIFIFGFIIQFLFGPRALGNDPFLILDIVLIPVGWLYWSIFESSAKQATLGKMIIGIKVTDLYGNRVSFLRATGRYFAKTLSGLILMVGYIMIAFTEKNKDCMILFQDV